MFAWGCAWEAACAPLVKVEIMTESERHNVRHLQQSHVYSRGNPLLKSLGSVLKTCSAAAPAVHRKGRRKPAAGAACCSPPRSWACAGHPNSCESRRIPLHEQYSPKSPLSAS